MPSLEPHRKRVRHYHEPGDVHELTFSCYRRLPLLTNNAWRTKLSRCLDGACQSVGRHWAGFVFMPEHVHLLIWGLSRKENVSTLLANVKQHGREHDDLLPRITPLPPEFWSAEAGSY